MKKPFSISHLKKPFTIIICSFIVISIVHLVLWHSQAFWRFCYFYSTPPHDDRIRFEATLQSIPANDKDKIFLLGASQIREAFDEEYLNNEFKSTGVHFYNLGYSGARPIDQFVHMKRILAKKPAAIIYMLNFSSFYMPYDFSALKYSFDPQLFPLLNKHLDSGTLWKEKQFVFDAGISSISFLYRFKESLRRILITAVYNVLGTINREQPISFRFPTDNNQKHFSWKMKTLEKDKGRYKHNPFTDLNKVLVAKYTEEIINKNITLIVLDGPLYPSFHKIFESEHLKQEYQDFMKNEEQRLGFTYIPTSKLPKFEKTEFADFAHLNKSGRQKLSLFLKDFLKKKNFNSYGINNEK